MNHLLQKLVSASKSVNKSQVEAIVSDLINLQAPLQERWVGVGQIAKSFGSYRLAKRCIEKALEQSQSDQMVAQALGMLSDLGKTELAYEYLQSIGNRVSSSVVLLHLKGVLAYQLGYFTQAKQSLREVLIKVPTSGETLHLLSTMSDTEEAKELQKELDTLLSSMDKVPLSVSKACFYNALGNTYLKTSEVDTAYQYFEKCAETMRAISPKDKSFDYSLIEGWRNENVECAEVKPSNFTDESVSTKSSPIFILGIPRTGTTLVEQVIIQNTEAQSVGEIDAFPMAVDNVLKTKNALERLKTLALLDEEKCSMIADEYFKICSEYGVSNALIVDKSLSNLRYAYAIKHVFNKAIFVVTKRNEIDNAWSIFKTQFSNSLHWSWDIRKIKSFIDNESRLAKILANSKEVAPIVIQLETLQDQPQETIKQVINRVYEKQGATRETELLSLPPYEAGKVDTTAVRTASMYQARQPISSDHAHSKNIPPKFEKTYSEIH